MAAGVLVGRGYVSIRPEFEGDWSRTASVRASQAGRSGAGAFSKAFNAGLKGIGVGLKGVGALAGVAIASNLQGAAASAALLAPALTTAATAAGALKLGLSGVGEAFKAAFADTSAQANSAASATRAVEAAQRGLANAQRSLADARVQAAERVRDAQRQVADAERDLADAQRDAREVQAELNDARREAARTLQDLNQRLAESRLDEREAVLRLKDAETELKEAQAKKGVTPEELERLNIAYERAKLNLIEQRRENARLAVDTKAANKAGVEGSEEVLAVKERISDANRDVADKERALGEAQRGVDEARKDGARQVADAQRAVADAAAAVADAQAAAAGQANEFDKAMAKLAPNARSFVNAVRDLAPAWTAMRLSVQNALFAGLDDTVTSLGRTTIPILKDELTATAGVWNSIAKNTAGAIEEMAKTGVLRDVLRGATDNLKLIERVPGQFLTMLGQLSVAAQPAFNKLTEQFAGAMDRISARLATAFESGALEQGIGVAIDILGQFFSLLGNLLGALGQITKAAADAGGQIVGVLSAMFAELKRVLALPEIQTALRQIFTAVAQVVAVLAPLLGAVVQQLVPLIAMFTPFIEQITTQMGPVLLELVTTLGTALAPILSALLPLLATVASSIVILVQSVMPLLQPIAQLITALVTALAPALTPIIGIVVQLVQVLVGPLTQIITMLVPYIELLGQVFTQIFGAIGPLLTPLLAIVGRLAQLFADVFTIAIFGLMAAIQPLIPVLVLLVDTVLSSLMQVLGPVVDEVAQLALMFAGVFAASLSEVMKAVAPLVPVLLGLFTGVLDAIVPLIPIGLELVQAVFGALTPVLPVVTELLAGLVDVLALLLPPITELVSELVGALAPILADLTPILADVAKVIVTGLAAVLPPLIDVVLILLEALTPLFPLIGLIAGIVVDLAGSLLGALLPPLAQLITAAVDLLVALVPILPPLAQIIGLVVGLAVKILSVLLPPLVRLVSFLVTVLAKALGTVIGWLAKLVSFIANSVGPTVTWLYRKVVKPGFEGIVTVISWAWKYGIKPQFDLVKKGIGAVRDAFKLGVEGIAKVWNGLKKVTSDPVRFVIDTVYNNGIRKVWNTVAKFVGLKQLGKVTYGGGGAKSATAGVDLSGKPLPMATGGVLPGYTPGRDVHQFYSPTGGRLALSGGEAVMRPEVTRALGVGGVNALNAAARSGGVEAVRRAMGFADGGVLHFDKGGVVGDIFGGLSDVAKKVGGAVMSGFDFITNPGKMWDKATGFIRDRLKDIGESQWAQALARVPAKILKGLKDRIIKAASGLFGDWGGASGSVAAAMKFARAQAGKPYIWGGVGPAGYDCSGFMSAIQNVILGRRPYSRNWATMSFGGGRTPAGWVKNLPAPYRVGITHAGVGHTAGTLAGLNVESRGGRGVVLGNAARGYRDPLFGSWYGFAPSMQQKTYDTGGWLQPGWTMAYNGLSQPEAVLTPGQMAALDAAPVRGGDGGVTYNIYPRASVLDRRELRKVQQHEEVRARVGRGR